MPRRSYTPADEAWFRWSDEEDLRGGALPVALLPGVLDDLDEHYAGDR